MLAAAAANSSSSNQPATANTPPTQSLDSLNGISVSMEPLIGPPPMSSAPQMNGDQHSDNGSRSESSSGVCSMAVNAGVAAAGYQGTNGLQYPNGVTNGAHQHGQVDRSSSTLCSSGLGPSPLGNATLPLFGGGISSGNSHATIINGNGNIGSLASHQQLSPQQLVSIETLSKETLIGIMSDVVSNVLYVYAHECMLLRPRYIRNIICPFSL